MMPSDTSEHEKKVNGYNQDDDSSRTRTRVSRACTRCRTRKDRCDGQRPSCSACVSAQQACCYEPSTKKRGLPEGYVRGLEKLFALLINKIQSFDQIVSQSLAQDRIDLAKIWNHSSVGEDLHTTWKDSKTIAELEALLSCLEQTSTATGQKRKREKGDDGTATDQDPDLTSLLKTVYTLSQPQDIVHASPSQYVKEAELPLSVPRQSPQLLSHYFAHTHCWFPILPRSELTRACYELTRGNAKDVSRAHLPVLWAVLAYTVSQKKFQQQHSSSPDTENLPDGQVLKDMSATLIPAHLEDCTLLHAQALLIGSLVDIGCTAWGTAWSSVGKAVRIVLNVLSENKTMHENTVAALQGCIVLDTVVAAHLGCVPHLRRMDVLTIPRLSEDGREEWEPWSGIDGYHEQQDPSFSISCFNQLTEVFLVLSDVLAIDASPDRFSGEYLEGLLNQIVHLQKAFPGQVPPTAQSPPHHVYLHLSHVLVQIHLVDLLNQSSIRGIEQAKLACNGLSLFSTCQKSESLSLRYLPPYLVDCFAGAARLANATKSFFGSGNGLPPFHEFERAMSSTAEQLQKFWPAFIQSVQLVSTTTNFSARRAYAASPTEENFLIGPSIGRFTGQYSDTRSKEWTPSVSSKTLQNVPSLEYGPEQHDLTAAPTRLLSLNEGTSSLAPRGSLGNSMAEHTLNHLPNSFDLDMTGQLPLSSVDPALMETSPSFYGDEIDAIFHEMAHLDTNEWTNERVTGLRDFGFADDSTFEAFCNDPDRLMGSIEGSQKPLSSNLQTWMFTSDMNSQT